MRQGIVAAGVACLLTLGAFTGLVNLGTQNASAKWYMEVVDVLGNVGEYSSIALDSAGYPHISYYDRTNSALKYAKWTGTYWAVETVDNTADVGLYSSIAWNGNVLISYYDVTNGDLKFAKGYSNGFWTIEIVESTDDVGAYSSIATDDIGDIHISYYYTNATAGALKYAHYSDGAGDWTIEYVDKPLGSYVGQHTSIAIDASFIPHISYYDVSSGDLKYAKKTGSWDIKTIDSGNQAGKYTSLALDTSNNPHISYYVGISLNYTRCIGAAPCTWTFWTVDNSGNNGICNSLGLDNSGSAHISYLDNWNRDLKYARWNGASWEIETVDSANDVGWWTSIALDNLDNAHISYYDSSNQDLKYVKWKNPPSKPQNLQANGGNGEVTLNWAAPSSNGGSPVSNYRIYRGTTPGSKALLIEIGDVLSYLDTTVIDGQTYFYNVSAVNENGESPLSNEASATPGSSGASAPEAPIGLTATGGNAQIALSWTAPGSDGGSPITNYRIYRGLTSGGKAFLVEVADVLSYVDTNVANGQVYYYNVSAVNAAGEGPQSVDASDTPTATGATVPSNPTGLIATPGDTEVTLTWNAPSSDGGSSIANYLIYRGTTPGGESFLVEIGNVLIYADTGLTNGQIYYYKVSAKNGVGEGSQSNEASATPDAITVPDAPTGLTATGGNAQIALSWTAPGSDGGSPITSYRIYRGLTSGAKAFLVEIGNILSYVDTNVVNGQMYYYNVSAVNAAGEGAQSDESSGSPTATGATAPLAPTGLTAVAGDTQVTLTWNAPSSDGGSPITNYRIFRGTTSGGESFLVEIGNVLIYTDTGVSNGQVYYYKVSARNGVGEGIQSNEASATPNTITVPTAPSGLTATGGNAQIALSWSAPSSNGGSPITNYMIYRGLTSGGQSFLMEVGNVLSYVDTSVANGQTYYYKVSAVNVAGEGAQSGESSGTPIAPGATAPSAPSGLNAVAGNGQVALTWSPPSSDGGSSVTNYRIFRGTTSGGETFLVEIGNLLVYTDASVTNGQKYYYKVSARNGAGEGAQSSEASATPNAMTIPAAPTGLTASGGNVQIALSWTAPNSNGGSPITNYRIYRGLTSGGQSFLAEIGAVLSYVDTDVAEGQTYYYRVSAVNAVGEGTQSGEASASPTVSGATAPSAPSGLVATAGDAQVSLTWSAPASDGGSPVTGYRIYRGKGAGQETFLAEIGAVESFIDTAVVNGQTYYYRVTALNSVGESIASIEVTGKSTGQQQAAQSSSFVSDPIFWMPFIIVFVLLIVNMALALRKKKGPEAQVPRRQSPPPQEHQQYPNQEQNEYGSPPQQQ